MSLPVVTLILYCLTLVLALGVGLLWNGARLAVERTRSRALRSVHHDILAARDDRMSELRNQLATLGRANERNEHDLGEAIRAYEAACEALDDKSRDYEELLAKHRADTLATPEAFRPGFSPALTEPTSCLPTVEPARMETGEYAAVPWPTLPDDWADAGPITSTVLFDVNVAVPASAPRNPITRTYPARKNTSRSKRKKARR
jgi:hypothetical protein